MAGLENYYLDNLTPWKEMLSLGFTTFAEAPEPSRSDCHGWSASPCYDLLATVSGITPSSPGFKTILVKPAPGNLTFIEAAMPHPNGVIAVKYQCLANNQWQISIGLPEKLTGTLIWNKKELKLKPGQNYFKF